MPKLYEVDGDVARPVPGFPNYRVYTDGSIYSLYGKGRFLNPSSDSDGYPFVNLYKDKKGYGKTTHVLVGRAFIPNPDNLPCIDHKDGDRTNNDVRNLRWVSYSTNQRNRHHVRGSSGHQGVREVHAQSTTRKTLWMAQWYDVVGKQCSKCFKTKEEAIAHRAAMVAKYYDRPTDGADPP